MVKAELRFALVASLCVGLTGCAAAVHGIVASALADLLKQAFPPKISSVNPYQLAQADRERCTEFTGKGVEVTEPVGLAIPTNEGEVQTFEATIWRLWAEGERFPPRERREPATAEGTLAITEQSVLLVPPPGTAGVRIPYEVVLTVELNPLNAYSITVNSCTGRFEIFNVRQGQRNILDPETAAAAAAQLKVRVTAFRATTHKQTESPQ